MRRSNVTSLSSKPLVAKISPQESNSLKAHLASAGYEFSNVPYGKYRASRPGITFTVYESGKLVAQGKLVDSTASSILQQALGRAVTNDAHSSKRLEDETWEVAYPHIGQDEAGKGDVFGPLCVAGVYVDHNHLSQLEQLNIQDTKLMSDRAVGIAAKKIKAICPYRVKIISPKIYNRVYSTLKNLNLLLARAHLAVFRQLLNLTQCPVVLVDQFAAPQILLSFFEKKVSGLFRLEQRVRAERDIAVCCAAVLSRDAFLNWLQTMSQKIGFQLPKGAGAPVAAAVKALYRDFGDQHFENLVKMHFKTVAENKN